MLFAVLFSIFFRWHCFIILAVLSPALMANSEFKTQYDVNSVKNQELATKTDEATKQQYLQGWDVSESKLVLVDAHLITNTITSAKQLDAHLKIIPGQQATAHLQSLPEGEYLYEWVNEKGTRFFAKERPNWYANYHYPELANAFPTKVYGVYGIKIDDTDFEQKLLKENRIYHSEKRKIERQQAEMQAKIDAGIIELGMDFFQVTAILGTPASSDHNQDGTVLRHYRKGTFRYAVRFKDNVVIDFKQSTD